MRRLTILSALVLFAVTPVADAATSRPPYAKSYSRHVCNHAASDAELTECSATVSLSKTTGRIKVASVLTSPGDGVAPGQASALAYGGFIVTDRSVARPTRVYVTYRIISASVSRSDARHVSDAILVVLNGSRHEIARTPLVRAPATGGRSVRNVTRTVAATMNHRPGTPATVHIHPYTLTRIGTSCTRDPSPACVETGVAGDAAARVELVVSRVVIV